MGKFTRSQAAIVGTKQKEGNWNSEVYFEDNSPLALQPCTKKHGKLSMGCRWEMRSWSPSNFAVPSVSLACAVALSALAPIWNSATRVRSRDLLLLTHLNVLASSGNPWEGLVWSHKKWQFSICSHFHLTQLTISQTF